jgi:hypothetical protein
MKVKMILWKICMIMRFFFDIVGLKKKIENILIFQPYVSLIVSGFKQYFTQRLQHKL